ncbi:MAG TPA: hypothetical protein ENN51_08705 [candidate division WOR-3 bacterium]|uniref:DUF4872 domain-containing protein n=1 Tax=candidate division WOR-3 bacterium TaxID=2052148 RepID=A0A7V0XFR9_UNCW3|nr:hypothetical protein [candidate division WOR-3 bacterium]
MQLEGLRQPPNSTSLMGVIIGVLRYHGFEASDAAAYGGSGHAFFINVHEELCPSGPYVWKHDWFLPLVGNLGIEMEDLGFFGPDPVGDERDRVEAAMRDALDAGRPCALANMENQLIHGYEEDRFLVTRPWDCAPDITPETLTFGTWAEFGDECHVNFYAFAKRERAEERVLVRDALRTAIELFREPGKYSIRGYRHGAGAYDNWLAAIEEHGGSHGNWWNATVWAECRAMAAAWFEELAAKLPVVAGPAQELAGAYRNLAGVLARVGDKRLAPGEKLPFIAEAREMEAAAVDMVEPLLRRLG